MRYGITQQRRSLLLSLRSMFVHASHDAYHYPAVCAPYESDKIKKHADFTGLELRNRNQQSLRPRRSYNLVINLDELA